MADLTYIITTTEDDYLRLTRTNLNEELKARMVDDVGDDNPAPAFIYSVENYLKEKIFEHNPFTDPNLLNEDYLFKTEHQTKMFKRATCYQISYLLKNGNITNNVSEVLTKEQMNKLGLDSNAERCLFAGGLWNIARC